MNPKMCCMSLSHIKHQRIQPVQVKAPVRRRHRRLAQTVPVATAAELFLQVSSWHLGGWLIKPSFEIKAPYRRWLKKTIHFLSGHIWQNGW